VVSQERGTLLKRSVGKKGRLLREVETAIPSQGEQELFKKEEIKDLTPNGGDEGKEPGNAVISRIQTYHAGATGG